MRSLYLVLIIFLSGTMKTNASISAGVTKAIGFLLCIPACINIVYAQTPVTLITYASTNTPTSYESSIKGAGYGYSVWSNTASFQINYSSDPSSDITSITSFNTSSATNFIPIPFPGAVIKLRRVANAVITDTRNFITSWNKASLMPLAGGTSGTFNFIAPKITSMEASLLSNNINSGYDNFFNNTTGDPHYNNIERVDYVVPSGFAAAHSANKIGFAIFDRGAGDDFKIAAITSIDASGNPTGYKSLLSVPASGFSPAGLMPSDFDYAIIVSDPAVASGESRPSTRLTQNMRGVFISLQNLGIAINETIYGYSLFAQDVNPASGHVLTNPATFPTNTSFSNCLDLVNVNSLFQSGIVLLPVKLTSFTGNYSRRRNSTDLNWTTSSEYGLSYFTIQKSYNSTDWFSIGNIQPAGNSSGGDYSFSDRNPGTDPRLYYRLKMVSDDSSARYSNTLSFNNTAVKEMSLLINESNLKVIAIGNIKEARILDISGKEILAKKNIAAATTTVEFSLDALPGGTYIIAVVDQQNATYSKKFMKL
jgi:hypothetical protein